MSIVAAMRREKLIAERYLNEVLGNDFQGDLRHCADSLHIAPRMLFMLTAPFDLPVEQIYIDTLDKFTDYCESTGRIPKRFTKERLDLEMELEREFIHHEIEDLKNRESELKYITSYRS